MLPRTMFAGRQGLETLLRRLTVGLGNYPNIETIVGTVTGVKRNLENAKSLSQVNVKTKDGDIDIDATLVIGGLNCCYYAKMIC
jgi:hypothetical protein